MRPTVASIRVLSGAGSRGCAPHNENGPGADRPGAMSKGVGPHLGRRTPDDILS